MGTLPVIVWSAALGAIAAVALARAGELLARPSVSQLRAVAYHLSVFLLVLVLSGLLRQATHPAPARLQVLQVLAGPLCVGLSNFWIHGWLGAARRDRRQTPARAGPCRPGLRRDGHAFRAARPRRPRARRIARGHSRQHGGGTLRRVVDAGAYHLARSVTI